MAIEVIVGKRIREERKRQGLTQGDLCVIIRKNGGRMRREYLSQIERGVIKNIRIRTINQIAKALEIQVHKLFSLLNLYSENELFNPDHTIEIEKIKIRKLENFNIKIKFK